MPTTILFGDVITTQVAEVLILGIVSGFLISLISKWSQGTPWNHAQFAYTWALSTFTAFGVLSKVTLTSDNFILTILAIFGGAFIANKGIQAANRLKAKAKKSNPP